MLNNNKVALTLGITSGVWHFLWVLSVWFGFGQVWVDWVRGLHFLNVSVAVTGIDIVTGVLGVAFAFVGGYIAGWVFSWVWNWLK